MPAHEEPVVGPAIHLLGAPRILREGVAVVAPRGRKAWALLAYLLQHPGGVGRSHLASLLFEDAEDPLAALRWSLSELRRALGGDGLRGDTLTLSRSATGCADVDVVKQGAWADALRVPGLERELLEGMSFPGSPSFEVWLAAERRLLQGSAQGVLREAALARLVAGAPGEAATLAGRLVRLDPLDENFQALLVRCLAAAGNGVGAARQVAACKALFKRELGVAPGPALEAALHTVTAVPTARPAGGRAGAAAQLEAGEAAIGAGVLEAGLHCLRRAIVDADGALDAELRTRARLALGGALVHAARGRDEEGVVALHEALAIGEERFPPMAAAACRELGYVELLRGRYERALPWLRRASSLAAGDRGEQARIANVRGCILGDTAHYGEALAVLGEAEARAEAGGDMKQQVFAQSMRGRALLLCGDLDAAAVALHAAVTASQRGWTTFLPWPQSLLAEVELQQGRLDAAAERFEMAFALGCQIGDPCWEGMAGRGLGRVAIERGEHALALDILLDTLTRCVRLPDAYLWAKGYVLDALCGLGVSRGLAQARGWVDELLMLSSRTGMRELTVRAHLHRAGLGEQSGTAAAQLLAGDIDNPLLRRRCGLV